MESKLDNLIAEYDRRKEELEAKWQKRKRTRSYEETFTLFVSCILSSRTDWDRVLSVTNELQQNGLLFTGSATELLDAVRGIGGMVDHEARAKWIVENREFFPIVFWLVDSLQRGNIYLKPEGLYPKDILSIKNAKDFVGLIQEKGLTPEALRTAVEQLKGAGDKQASHFLTSLGFEGYATIDAYILDKLVEFHLIPKKPNNLSSSRYHTIEQGMKH
ncbi:MAG: 8-oxoguanine DNA glycosylase [Candidatus Thorarchaeota archaeon]|jgi:thermostable 8-oxoguanine DNA glycosylase